MDLDLKHVKTLVVEDNSHTMKLVRTILNGIGVGQVFTAVDGADALNFIHEAGELINFIVCDWNMPKMTGIELLHEVKAIHPEMPFLMITARATAESVKAARKAGVDAYIAKPFSPQTLEEKIIALARQITEAAA